MTERLKLKKSAAGRARHAHASRDSRGSALLFVLVALAVVLPASLGLARAVTTAKIDRHLRHDEQFVAQVLIEADAPIQEFLTKRAGDLVLPADAPHPAALVLAESWSSGTDAVDLQIVAWDQCGLVSMDDARGATTLRLALQRSVIEALERRKPKGSLPGLDWFAVADEPSPFPPMPKVIVLEGVANLSWPSSVDSALGAWIATHNPGHLNVSTAPLAIVEAALREVGRGGIDEIAAARAEGRRVPVPNAAAGAQDDEKHGPDFVSSSDAWAFRVDARVGHVHRSQWLQYRPQESRWRCVQRLLITSG